MALRKHAPFFRPRNTVRTTPDIGYEETALSEAQRASARKLQLELSIAADRILDLCRLGWLDPDTAQDPEAVGDAVAELTNAALARAQRDLLHLSFALADANRLGQMFTSAGFREVRVERLLREDTLDSFDEYWDPIEAGNRHVARRNRVLGHPSPRPQATGT